MFPSYRNQSGFYMMGILVFKGLIYELVIEMAQELKL